MQKLKIAFFLAITLLDYSLMLLNNLPRTLEFPIGRMSNDDLFKNFNRLNYSTLRSSHMRILSPIDVCVYVWVWIE